YGSVVGLIGASRIGRLVAELLRPFDIEVLISDPYVGATEIAALCGTKVELAELFSRSGVVSLQAPDVPPTQGVVSPELRELRAGRVGAGLAWHDQRPPDDPLWDLATVSITPHSAGSQGNELHRMGEYALEEIRRLACGEPARYPVDPALLDITA